MKADNENLTPLENQPINEILLRGYSSNKATITFTILVFSAGMNYVRMQWRRNTSIQDAIFVGLLIFATLILLAGLKYIYKYLVNRGYDSYLFVMSAADPDESYRQYEKFVNSIMDFRGSTLAGLIYGTTIGLGPFVLHIWDSDISLKILLAIFLFVSNYVTGIAFRGLIVFFLHAFKFGRMITVELWQRDNPSTSFLFGANRRIVLLASVYVSLSISAIIFSLFTFSALVVSYSIFAGVVLLATFIFPYVPIAQKIQAEKAKVLFEINNELNEEFYKSVEDIKSGWRHVDLSKFNILLELREKTKTIKTWPLSLRSVSTGFSIMFFTTFPVFLQYALEYMR